MRHPQDQDETMVSKDSSVENGAVEQRISTAKSSQSFADNDMQAFLKYVPAHIAWVASDGSYLASSRLWDQQRDKVVPSENHGNFLNEVKANSRLTNAFKKAILGETVGQSEAKYTLLDGTEEYVTWEIQPWVSQSHIPSGVVVSISIITDQVKARLEAERQNQLFNAVLENVNDGIVACDHTGTLTLFNSQTRKMHGLDAINLPLEKCGAYYSLFNADGVTPLEGHDIPLFKALNGKKIVDKEMIIAPEGLKRRDVVTKATPLFDGDNNLIGAVASMTDVTDAKSATQKLKISEKKANHIA